MVSKSVLEAALLSEAPRQWECFQKNRLKRVKGLPKWKRELEEIDSKVADARAKAEELRRQYDPELMRIQANLDRKVGVSSSLSCPKCHDTDHGNKMNGKPWCIKDNIPLVPKNVPLESPFQVKKRLPDVKVFPKTKRIETTFVRLDE